MRHFTNIEPSAFRRFQYVGYADGVWHINRSGTGWLAVKTLGHNTETGDTRYSTLHARTLAELSALLSTWSKTHDHNPAPTCRDAECTGQRA